MKYFILKLNKTCSYVPQLKEFEHNTDLMNAAQNKANFLKLPEHMIVPVKTTEQTVWADILTSPVFLLSKKVKDLIEIYDDTLFSKDMIFLDQKNLKSKTYYMIGFEKVKGNVTHGIVKGRELINIQLEPSRKINHWTNIFQVEFNKTIYTIINLDLAESLMRRKAEGVGLDEAVVTGFL